MGDLISRKSLMRKLFYSEDGKRYPILDIDNFPITITLEELRNIIRDIDCAYDVDMVVERLKEESYEYFDTPSYAQGQCWQLDLFDAIEIVKSGGIE